MSAVKMYNSFLQIFPRVCQYCIPVLHCSSSSHRGLSLLSHSSSDPALISQSWVEWPGEHEATLIHLLLGDKEHTHTFPTGFPQVHILVLFQHTLDMPAVLSYTVLEIKLCQILLQNGSVDSKIQHNPRGKSKLGLHRMLAAAHYFSPFQFLTKYMALKKRDLISAHNLILFGTEYFDQATLKLWIISHCLIILQAYHS